MGKPMKNRILSIALALSMLVVAAAAINVNASVTYTGSVITTDNAGTPKDTFYQGELVYVNIVLNQDGAPYAGTVTVQLVRTTDDTVVSSTTVTTNNPEIGRYNSSGTGVHLHTGAGFAGDAMTYDVVVSYGGDVVAKHPIVVKSVGLTLQPASEWWAPYYPGQTVTITIVTDHTTAGFYVQVVNSTGATLFNITNQIAWTGWWSYEWTIASDFPDGHFYMHVNDATTHANWYSEDVYVQKYVLSVNADRAYYLIGETAMINYAVLDQASMEPYGGVVITYSATFIDLAGNQSWHNDTLVGTTGTQSFLIDSTVNISGNVDITYWANETGTDRSYSVVRTLYTGVLSAAVEVSDTSFQPGDLVAVTITAMAGYSNLPGAVVDLAIERNNSAIPAYGAVAMVTDFQGTVTHTFRLDSTAPTGSYIVNVTVSKVGQSVNEMSVFTVSWGGSLIINFDKNTYYGGDTAQVTFRTVWNGADMPDEPIGYYVQVSYGILLSGNTTTDSAEIAIPTDYYGFLVLFASVNVNGNIMDSGYGVNVNFANILLTTDQSHYRQGETLTFHWDIVTSLDTADLEYEVVDNYGVTVLTDKPSFAKIGSFSVDVPQENPPQAYTATVVMTTETGGYLTSSATVTIADNYELQLWFGKSGYANGDYKPGQTVKVHYEINAWAAKLPVYMIVLETTLEEAAHTYLVTGESGTFDFVIPKSAPTQLFQAEAALWDPIADDELSGTPMMLYNVNSELGAWDKSVGGMSAIDMVILILIVVMILLLIIVPFMKGRMGSQPQTMKVSEPPPAPPPSP
jgi:Alpha-2-macroglobulin bait region domain